MNNYNTNNSFKIIFLSFILFFLISPASSFADWGTDFLDNMKGKYTEGAAISSQGKTFYSGGGWSYSGADNKKLQFVKADPGGFSAGCGGIDISFGGISFLSKDELVEFLESLLEAAPGYAMELGLQTLCPSCLDIMNAVRNIAQAANNGQLDACGTLQAAGNAVSKALSSNANARTAMGKINSWNQSIRKNVADPLNEFAKFIDTAFSCLKGDPACPITFTKGEDSLQSLVVALMKKEQSQMYDNLIDLFGTTDNSNAVGVLAGLYGDIYLTKSKQNKDNADISGENNNEDAEKPDKAKNKSSGESIIPVYVNSKVPNAKKLVYKLAFNESSIPPSTSQLGKGKETVEVPLYKFIATKSTSNGKGKGNYDVSFEEATYKAKVFRNVSKEQLSVISTAFKGRTELSAESLKYLASFKVPVYKILNTYSYDTTINGAFDSFIQSFEVLSAAHMTYEVFNTVGEFVQRALVEYYRQINSTAAFEDENNNFMEYQAKILEQIRILNTEAYKVYVDAYDEFYKNMKNLKSLEDMQKIQKATLARHPVMGQAFFLPTMGK